MRKWIPALVIALAFGASAAVYQNLPEQMPSHFGMNGEVDGWTSRPWGAFMLPGVMLALLAMLYLLPMIDPRRASYAKFKGTYEVLITALLLFMFGLHLLILAVALGKDVSMERVIPMGVAVLLIVIGNLLPRTRPNWFIGIRTPWTLSSDRVWERTHRFGGRVFVATGVVALLAALVAPSVAFHVLTACAVAGSVAVLVYSYVIWKRDPDARSGSAASVRGH